MTLCRNRSNSPRDAALSHYTEKAEANQGRRSQAACGEVRVGRNQKFIKSCHSLMQLCAEAADQQIVERGKLTPDERRTIFDLPIRLSHRQQNNITFPCSSGSNL